MVAMLPMNVMSAIFCVVFSYATLALERVEDQIDEAVKCGVAELFG